MRGINSKRDVCDQCHFVIRVQVYGDDGGGGVGEASLGKKNNTGVVCVGAMMT